MFKNMTKRNISYLVSCNAIDS